MSNLNEIFKVFLCLCGFKGKVEVIHLHSCGNIYCFHECWVCQSYNKCHISEELEGIPCFASAVSLSEFM